MRAASTLLASVLLGGCATHPGAIAPTVVSSEPYRTFGCVELGAQLAQSEAALAQLERKQTRARVTDAVLNVLFVPGFGAATPDYASEVAAAKGVVGAIRRETDRRCVEGVGTVQVG